MPLDSSAACVRVIHDAHPLWIPIEDDPASRALFDKMKWKPIVLALPLFGLPEMSSNGGRDSTARTAVTDHYWSFEPGLRLGVLYIGARQDSVDSRSLSLLRRFSDRIGVVASLAAQQERLGFHLTQLKRGTQLIKSVL